MKKSVYSLILLLLGINISLYAQTNRPILQESVFEDATLASGVLSSYKTFEINLDELKRLGAESPEHVWLSVPKVGGGNFDVALQKRNVLSNGFSVKTSGGSVQAPLDYGIHYGGKLQDDSGSLVAFSFYRHCMFGLIATDEGNFNIVFLRDENGAPTNRYVLYNDRALTIPNTFSCATDRLPQITGKQTNHSQKAGGGECRQVTQYLECDYAMYQDNAGNVQNTVSWATGMFNVMAHIYHNEDINIQISEIFVWDTPDSYPTHDSAPALFAFGDARQDNFNGDLAHLLSTVSSGNGGIAWLDILCEDYSSSSSYGRFAYSNINDAYNNLPLWSWTVNVITHETGHNLGSPHTQWCGWEVAPNFHTAIDSCYATEDYNGSVCYDGPDIGRTGTVMSYCHITGNVNLNLGFGPLPGNLIRERVADASCIATYSGPALPVITGNTQYCYGDEIQLTGSSPDGNVTWFGPNGFSSSSPGFSIPGADGSDAGLYVASVTSGPCTSSEFVTVQVTLKPSTPNIVQSGNSLKCYPSSPSYTYQWYDANGNPVGTGQTFTPGASGQYYVIISRNGCSSNQSTLFDFTLTSYASVQENETDVPIFLWPNPASREIFVSYENNTGEGLILQIIDMSGRTVSIKSIVQPGMQTLQVDISHLSEGMYILELNQAGKRDRTKFLVRN